MKLTQAELEFLATWAREEWEPSCYQMPAHRLQLAHGVSGAQLIQVIKAWTAAEGKKDQDILGVAENPSPRWPWFTNEDFDTRLSEAALEQETRRATAGQHATRINGLEVREQPTSQSPPPAV
ncbi:MAG: hypothetical protein HY040_15525 [Planctomycetes bacterium]|nr:hypothetical protein [Planctomycetota bacterium]